LLQGRLAVLLDRLRASGVPAAQIAPVAAALDALLAAIVAAEAQVPIQGWVAALRAAQQCRPLVRALLAAGRAAPPGHGHADPVFVSQALWVWLLTEAELYCKVQIIHQGLALRDIDQLDEDNDAELIDFTGHVGEELTRQIAAAEREVLAVWPGDRYRLYRLLHTSLHRLCNYTRGRGWIEEAGAFKYRMHLAHMYGLHYYVWSWHAPGPRESRRLRDRVGDWVAALGRLLIDRFYWLVAGFGYRPLRALVINSLVVTAFAALYWQLNLLCVFYTAGGTVSAQQCQPVSFPQALYFSALAFFLAAMGEVLPRPLLGQALLVLESIWGFLNVSVVIAVILSRQAGGD
ncbi:MAG TPA: hypothetical protein VKY74_18060, partial [Chloroflexia bacterium]|nr:hypothetical protein [Chloroflexia bacterium]